MQTIFKILFLSILSSSLFAQDILLEGTPKDSLDSTWDLVGKALIVKDSTPYIRVDTRGNCRWEWRQVCTPNQSGGVTCKPEAEWTCDYNSGLFSLPQEVKAINNEVRYINGEDNIKVGQMKNFLFWKWVSLESYVGIFTDIETARLIIRNPEEVKKEIQFNQLHK